MLVNCYCTSDPERYFHRRACKPLLAFVMISDPVLHDTADDASIRHNLFRFLHPVFDIQLLASVIDISAFHLVYFWHPFLVSEMQTVLAASRSRVCLRRLL